MRRLLSLIVPVAFTLGGCLPNPQSEWTSSAGGLQRSTLEDPTILAQSTVPPPGSGFFDFDWTLLWSDGDPGGPDHAGVRARERAHPSSAGFASRVVHETSVHHVSSSSGGGRHR
jgi:hypothetical protein